MEEGGQINSKLHSYPYGGARGDVWITDGTTFATIGGVGPRPLVVRKSVPLLAILERRVDPNIEKIERRLRVSQLGFHEAGGTFQGNFG